MRINTNLTAMNTFNQVTKNQNKISGAVSQLSSGSAINSAADNAAGLAISEKMRAQIRGLDKASSNAQDAISLVQTAEGALSQSTSILQRMRELAVQSSSDTNQDAIDRAALQDEFSQLQKEIDDISKNTTFNKKNLLDGSLSKSTSNISNAAIANSSLTFSLGNADAGKYYFSVDTKLEKAAVTGQQATSKDLVLNGAAGFFSNQAVTNKVELGANAAESSLLNGNYTMSAKYGDDGNISVTATGDNGQTFSATINNADLTKLATAADADRKIELTFNASANDAFKVTVGLTSNIASTSTNFETLADNISKMTVSIAGGITAEAAQYGVYANLTGAESIKLESGMSSVTFGNGVKVNFDTLTSSAVDTANKGRLDDAGTGILAGNNNVAAAASSSGYAITYSNFKATDNSTITNSTADDFAITQAAGKLTATIGGKSYYSTPTAAQMDALEFAATDTEATTPTKTTTFTFTDAAGNSAFTIDAKATLDNASSGTAQNTATTVSAANLTVTASANGRVENVGHNYAKLFSNSTTNLSASTSSNFTVEETKNAGLTFQVGANEGDTMTINVDKLDSNYLGVASASVATQTAAASAVKAVDKAINQVSAQRAYLGAVQNRLEDKINNLNTSSENLTSAESQIRDVDMAKEMTTFTNANILSQASTAMLAQANSLPQSVLKLIG